MSATGNKEISDQQRVEVFKGSMDSMLIGLRRGKEMLNIARMMCPDQRYSMEEMHMNRAIEIATVLRGGKVPESPVLGQPDYQQPKQVRVYTPIKIGQVWQMGDSDVKIVIWEIEEGKRFNRVGYHILTEAGADDIRYYMPHNLLYAVGMLVKDIL